MSRAALKRISSSFLLASLGSFLFLSLFFFQSVGFASPIPKPQGDIYVQDFAHLLSSDQKRELILLGRSLEDQTKAQVAVLTVETLGGLSIEDFSLQAFRDYRLGDQTLNNGVLLVIATKDRKARIEVGYGLEGALPDGKVGSILDEVTLPALREGKADQAIINTYRRLVQEAGKEYGADITVPKESQSESSPTSINSFWLAILIGFLIVVDMIFFHGRFTYLIFSLLSIFGRGRGGGGGGFGGNRGGGGGSSGGGGASRGW